MCTALSIGRAAFGTTFGIGDKRWPLPGQPGSAEFTARYDALLCQCLATDQAANVAFGPGTVGLVIEKYLASADYISKAVGTQQVIASPSIS